MLQAPTAGGVRTSTVACRRMLTYADYMRAVVVEVHARRSSQCMLQAPTAGGVRTSTGWVPETTELQQSCNRAATELLTSTGGVPETTELQQSCNRAATELQQSS
jgi:hypothetical protein